jgi:hypothetical protein
MKTSAILVLLFLVSGAMPVHAKRVVCVDEYEDEHLEFIHSKEGYERARAMKEEVTPQFVLGGELKDCLAKVADNDELVIIAHGDKVLNEDGSMSTVFFYNGVEYEGFGDGDRLAPLPPGFNALKNVTVTFCTCYSALDLDGPGGPQKSLLDQLISAMGGKANHPRGTGFVDKVKVYVHYTVKLLVTNKEEKVAIYKAVTKLLDEEDGSWALRPPVNRPGVADNQQTAAQALVNAKIGTGKASIEIAGTIYEGKPNSSGYEKPRGEVGFSEKGIVEKEDCGCEQCDAQGVAPPLCLLWDLRPGPPVVLEILAQDEAEGLCAIEVLQATNASVDVPSFAPGEPGPLFVTATKIDQTRSSTVELNLRNCNGSTTICDPVLSLVVREEGKPVRHNFSGVPQAESKIEIRNGVPGLRNLKVTVNGVQFHRSMRDGDVWTFDAASAMLPGESNSVAIDGRGKPGGSALIVIHD